jgi:hypothetical protein
MDIDYQKLAATLLAQAGGMRQKAVSSTPTTVYGHGGPYGQAGLFSFPGLERDVMNAMIMPRLGLLDALTSRTANTDNPLYGIMTGVTASTGSNPVGVCDDPPVAGLMKLCQHSFVWGRASRMTRVFDLDRFGHIRNRSDFLDLNLVGDPLAVGPNPWMPAAPGGADPAAALRNEISKAMFEFAVAWGRDFARLLYTGNPTNNTAGGGYKEPYGLDILINTGYRDAETGVACPAADSIVRTFNASITANAALLLRQITNIYRNLKYIAQRAGLAPAKWVLVGPWAMFYELTEIWPCSYLSYRCTTLGDDNRGVVDLVAQNDLRDSMRNGQYLLIDGEQVPFITDDGIAETEGAGSSSTGDLYFVPITVLGGRPVTFLEYFNYDAPGAAMEAAKIFAPQGSYFTTNGGRYLWHAKPPTNFCVQMLAKSEWRIIMETPHLAARLNDLIYTPVAHQRSPFPSDTSYFVDGGGTNRDALDLSFYTPTA